MMLPLLLALAASPLVDTVGVVPPAASTPAEGAPRHALVPASVAGMSDALLLRAPATLAAEVQRGGFPGAALAVGRGASTVVEQGIGHLDWSLGSPAVDPDRTLYDLASLTKVVATTTAVMLLVEDGRMELDAPVSRYLPGFRGGARDRVTIRHLLTHTSGLPAWNQLAAPSPETSLRRAIEMELEAAPGARVEYSDVGFVVLWAAAERAHGEPLHRLLDRRVFEPLGMRSTTFVPGEWCRRCAPTDQRSDGTNYSGTVHDPIARRLDGIAGNAGLFSTAHDLARFAAMLAGGGELDGVRVLREETIRTFTQRQPGAETRALGWDTPDQRGRGAGGLAISPNAFGHTGFTGTSLWVDPVRGTWTVLLSNRTYRPRASNHIQSVRRTVHDWVAAATDQNAPAER